MARFGRRKRSTELLQAGLRLAEEHHLNAWYFRFEKELEALQAGEQAAAQEAIPATPTSVSYSPAMEEVAIGLREYALAAN
jgi:hypothetical protein